MRVLLVLGEQRLQDALVAAFRFRWPDGVLLTSAGAETDLWHALERGPDVVVVDADLPERSGFEVLADIRRTSDAPVVLLTAGDRHLDEARAQAVGASLHLPKPFSTEALFTFVGQQVEAARHRGPRRSGHRARAAAVTSVISAAVLIAALLGPMAATNTTPYKELREAVVCDLPPDLIVDRFEELGWCPLPER